MIRDPSDGTVKEPAKPIIDAGTSGLRTDKLKVEELARLEKSRDWLKEYFHRKPVQSPESGEG